MSKRLAEIIPAQLTDDHYTLKTVTTDNKNAFVEHNKLRQRWQAFAPKTTSPFVIAETCFAGGLNFLAAAELWLELAPTTAKLHFIGLEAEPLCRSDLKLVLQQASKTSALARELIANYPMLSSGYHRLFFAEQRVCLTLIFVDTDASPGERLAQLRPSLHSCTHAIKAFTVDAWFLHSPAPTALLEQLQYLSSSKTTLVSLDAEESIRSQLQVDGFALEIISTSGDKPSLFYGQWNKPVVNVQVASEKDSTPRYRRKISHQTPWHISALPHRSMSRHAAIIGGGIAGCTTAAALAQRGWHVTLYERHSTLAQEGSGNPQGIIYPKLSPQSSALSRINLSAIQFASRYYKRYWQEQTKRTRHGQQCGVLVLPDNEKETSAFKAIAHNFQQQKAFIQLLDKDAIEEISGLELDASIGLYYPKLGWINPGKVCQSLVEHPLIHVEQANINALCYQHSLLSWQLSTEKQLDYATADTVILASSTSTKQFSQSAHLPIKSIRGQISITPARRDSPNQDQKKTQVLKTVLCGAGYIAPENNGQYTFGASYSLNTTNLNVRIEDHQHNIDLLEQSAVGLNSTLQIPTADKLKGRAALRCTTLDYLPIIGPAPVYELFLEDYSPLRHDARVDIARPGQYWPGLYIHCGLGSRGLSYAPLGAELLASQINGEPPILERDLLTALNPARFIIRDMKRRKI